MGLFSRTTDNAEADEDAQDSAEAETKKAIVEGKYDPTKPKRINGKEWWIERINEHNELETYAGEWCRAMIENAVYEPRQPMWLGCSERTGREFGIEFTNLFEHVAYLGSTGSGKTTAVHNSVLQPVMAGHGVGIVDPKGDDLTEFLRRIPERRWDDVVYVDIKGTWELEHPETGEMVPYHIGFNILETYHDPDEPGYDAEVEWIVDNFIQIAGIRPSWSLARRVLKTIVRWMTRHEEEFTIIEVFYAILSEENRAEFSHLLGEHVENDDILFIESYLAEITDNMSTEELNPLIGKLKDWIEEPMTRRVVAQRGAGITLSEVVNGKKILVVNNDLSKELRKKMASVIKTGVWSAVTGRMDPTEHKLMQAAGMDVGDNVYEPFFLSIDECHAVFQDEDNIEGMLMEARSKQLGLLLSTQTLRSLPESAAHAIMSNCRTVLSMDPGDPTEAKLIAAKFGDIDPAELQRTPEYHALTQLNNEDDPFLAKMIPPYPPRHSIDDAHDLITLSLRNYGTPAQTGREIVEDIHFDVRTDFGRDGNSDPDDADEIDVASDPAEQALYEAVYTIQIKRDAIGEFVDNEAVKDEWRRRAGELGFTSEVSNVIEQAPDEYIERGRRDGKSAMRVTPEGLEYAGLAQDTGSSASGGGDEHRWVLTEAYRAFTKLGMHVDLPTQEGDEDPDGLADLPIDPMAGNNMREIREREQQLAEAYPYLHELTDGLNISIEAETTTLEKPMQTLTNLRKAIDAHKLCVFACKDGTANHDEFDYWPRRGEGIIYDTSGRGRNRSIHHDRMTFAGDVDEAGNRTFYNKVNTLAVGPDSYALRPQSEADLEWREDGEAVVMADASGTEHARFESLTAVADPSKADVPAYSEYDASSGEYTVRSGGEKLIYGSREELQTDWMVVRAPFIPDHEFERLPTPEDFLFVVFPDNDTDEFDEPMICERGETRPLLPSDHSRSTNEKSDGNEVETTTGSDEQSAEPSQQKSADEQDGGGGVSFSRSGR